MYSQQKPQTTIFSLGFVKKPEAGEAYDVQQLYNNIVKILPVNVVIEGLNLNCVELVAITQDLAKFKFRTHIRGIFREFSSIKAMFSFLFGLKDPPEDYRPYLENAKKNISIVYVTPEAKKIKIPLSKLIPDEIKIQQENDRAIQSFVSSKKKEQLEAKRQELKRRREQERADKEAKKQKLAEIEKNAQIDVSIVDTKSNNLDIQINNIPQLEGQSIS